MTSSTNGGMTATLISPSGMVLLYRASCNTEPAEEAHARSIRIQTDTLATSSSSIHATNGLTSGDDHLIDLA